MAETPRCDQCRFFEPMTFQWELRFGGMCHLWPAETAVRADYWCKSFEKNEEGEAKSGTKA